ncbi:MAG: hypothetical protein LC737_04350, partial [Chloroflexi bacterium]|nr:hypothetical protein [Chloroflexota bacterium]
MNYFTVEKITKLLPDLHAGMVRAAQDITHWKFCEGDCPDARDPNFDDSAWRDFQTGDYWGGYDVT